MGPTIGHRHDWADQPIYVPVHEQNGTYMSLTAHVRSREAGHVASPSSPAGSIQHAASRLTPAPRGSSSVAALVTWWLPRLRRWTHGRLPAWARSAADTSDIVQDVLLRT